LVVLGSKHIDLYDGPNQVLFTILISAIWIFDIKNSNYYMISLIIIADINSCNTIVDISNSNC